MDILAHTLWAGAGLTLALHRWPVKPRTLALPMGLAALPDMFHLLPILAWWLVGDGTFATVRAYAIAVPGSEPGLPPIMRLLSHHLHCVAHSAIVAAAVTLLLGARCCRAVAVAVAVQVMASDIGGADRPRSAAASVDNADLPHGQARTASHGDRGPELFPPRDHMKLTDFKALSFDCYGTLIDWETGLFKALAQMVDKAGLQGRSRDEILATFAEHEADQEARTPAMPYSQLLSVVYQRLAQAWKVPVTSEQANIFGASVPDWPEFPDSAPALQYLKQHFKLVILSNVDRISFRGSNARLKVEFDAIYTAQDIGSYKPSPRNFEYLLRRVQEDFGLHKNDILHTAQSLFHDHAPANAFGISSAWIDRRHASKGWGATMPPPGTPKFDFRFESMAALAKAHQEALRAG